jgi:rod shape determining protein RodA
MSGVSIWQKNKTFDWGLLILIFLLVAFGLIVQYDLSFDLSFNFFTSDFGRQLIFSLIGFILVFIFSRFDFRLFRSISYVLYGISLLALVGVLIFGKTFHGVRGWLSFGFFNFQLVELAKLTSILALASFWQRTIRPLPFSRILLSLIFVAPPMILVILQPDVGSALILFLTWLGIILLVDNNWKYITTIFVAIVLVVILVYFFGLHAYQRDRISTYFNPSQDPLGRGYQIAQSKLAIGSGGIFGRGLALTSHGSFASLPAAQTDFIFAAIAQRAGLLGCLIIFTLFFLIFSRLIKLIQKIYDNFALILVVGIAINFFVHFVLNIGMNLGFVPIIGIPLPFLSYGGSYLLISFVFIGLIESVNVHRLFINQEKDIV